jgi:hypothetical protein
MAVYVKCSVKIKMLTSEPGPFSASEVRHENVCVLEICDEH